MFAEDPKNLKQDRRQWLKTSATLLGASILPAPTALSEATGPKTATGASKDGLNQAQAVGRLFTPAEQKLIEELSETIIPADDHSGGAKAAKVVDFIENVLHSSLDDAQKSNWHQGLKLVDSISQHHKGKIFVDLDPAERVEILKVLSDNDHITELPEIRFFRDLKGLTIQGYYTTKVGIHDELEYKGNRFLTEFVGCDDTPQDDK